MNILLNVSTLRPSVLNREIKRRAAELAFGGDFAPQNDNNSQFPLDKRDFSIYYRMDLRIIINFGLTYKPT